MTKDTERQIFNSLCQWIVAHQEGTEKPLGNGVVNRCYRIMLTIFPYFNKGASRFTLREWRKYLSLHCILFSFPKCTFKQRDTYLGSWLHGYIHPLLPSWTLRILSVKCHSFSLYLSCVLVGWLSCYCYCYLWRRFDLCTAFWEHLALRVFLKRHLEHFCLWQSCEQLPWIQRRSRTQSWIFWKSRPCPPDCPHCQGSSSQSLVPSWKNPSKQRQQLRLSPLNQLVNFIFKMNSLFKKSKQTKIFKKTLPALLTSIFSLQVTQFNPDHHNLLIISFYISVSLKKCRKYLFIQKLVI